MAGSLSVPLSEELQLECNVCFEWYKNPVLLPCLHSFCQECVTSVADGRHAFQCPVCRAHTAVPAGGVSAFPANVYMAARVERADRGNAIPQCSVCTHDQPNQSTGITASHRCVDCDKRLCGACLRVHDALLPSHTLTSLSTTGPIQVSKVAYCRKHPTENLRFQCLTCSVPVCRDCRMTLHAEGHQCRDLSEMSQAAKAVMSDVTQLVTHSLLPVLAIKSETCAEALREKQASKRSLEQSIRQREEELITAVKEAASQALNTVAEAVKKFEDEYAQNERTIARLKNQCDYYRLVMEGGCEADVLLAAHSLKTTFLDNSFPVDNRTATLDQAIQWDKSEKMYFGDLKSDTGYFSLQDWKTFTAAYLGRACLCKKKKSRANGKTSFRSAVSGCLQKIQASLSAGCDTGN